MRPVVLALVPFLALSGCFTQVTGDPPAKACGSDGAPAQSNILGTEASWAGRKFTANEDGVVLSVRGGESDAPDNQWWGVNANAWAVAALRGGEVVEAHAGLVQYGNLRTTVHVAGGGYTYYDDGDMILAHNFIGPLTLNKGESLFVVGTADQAVSALSLVLEWKGCGETGEIVYGHQQGFVAGWAEFDAPLILANDALGTMAYEAHYEQSAGLGLVLAQPPRGDDPLGRNEARVKTSAGEARLDALSFFLHTGGPIEYDVTHMGEAGKEPLLAYMPLEQGGGYTLNI